LLEFRAMSLSFFVAALTTFYNFGAFFLQGCNLLMYLEEVVGSELFSRFVASYIDK
jgi:hypothetical protein